MTRVCDWQLKNFRSATLNRADQDTTEAIREDGWIRGVAYAGVLAHYRTTRVPKYLEAALQWAERNHWQPGPRVRHADDQCVVQAYTEMYFLKKAPAMLEASREHFDAMLAAPKRGPVAGWNKSDNWAWCDALFMAPPAMARMARASGDRQYLELMDTLWWDTHDYLYDPAEHLYYRDAAYVVKPDGTGPRTVSGQKVFWGRGNGWVIAGLVRVLQYLPPDFRNRSRYEVLFREMADRIAGLQQPDGLWRSSLNEPVWFPAKESSCSALFCFALAWGINTGLLEQSRYEPVVERAWRGLVGCVEPSGKIGWVQLTGHDPRPVFAHDTLDYAAGGLLLAGEQLVALKSPPQRR